MDLKGLGLKMWRRIKDPANLGEAAAELNLTEEKERIGSCG